jgi:phosphopentomutase
LRRALLLVLDSLGVGASEDAARFGDAGADTLGHLAVACAHGAADRPGIRSGPLSLPHLERLGLGEVGRLSTGHVPAGFTRAEGFEAAYGFAVERSCGKDTPSGHWEMTGVPVDRAWTVFPAEYPSFPAPLVDALVTRAGLPGVIGQCAASGTQIVDDLGAEHLATGCPIVYTSADSVFQIAAHEEAFGLDRLYGVCAVAREIVDAYGVGRVIARPFTGRPGAFRRTANRRDYTMPPPEPTLLDRLTQDGGCVVAIGKIADIFAHRGVSEVRKAVDNDAIFEATLRAAATACDRTLLFANFVDFDMRYGHRRDVAGYAAALETFDRRLPDLETALRPGDLVILTADHGCDPTWSGSDHTREHVPVLAFGPDVEPVPIGRRETFADVGQTIAAHFGLAPLEHGEAFL